MAESRYLQELRRELDDVKGAISDLRNSGQEYALVGSHSRKGVQYADLMRSRRELENKIARLNGGKSFTLPDFS